MAKSEVRRVVILLDGKEVENNAKAIRKEMRNVRKEFDSATIGSEKYKDSFKKLGELKGHLDKHRKTVGRVNGAWRRLRETFIAVTASLGVVALINKIVTFIPQLVGGVAKVSDELSAMQKTIGGTKDEMKELNNELGKINTRTSRSELRKIAQEGGRLGIAKDKIVEFTRETNKAAVALGDDFGGGSDVVASKLGKLNTLFKETKNIKIGDAINKSGSAINELGANTKATAPNITAFATNVGQLSGALKPTIQDALGLGAAFDESGLQADNASRAYGIFLGAASTNTDKFAEAIGLSIQETENLINTNPAEFFLTFSESMKGLPATETSRLLKDLGLNANEVKKIIGAAGENTDRFRQIMDLSNKSFTDATSLTNEYNLVNDNLAGKLERLGKIMSKAFTDSRLMNGIEWLVDKATEFTEIPMSETIREEQVELNVLVQRITDVNTKQGDRNKLVEELQNKYPEFLGNINAETASNEQLRNRLKEVNKAYVTKIALAEMDAEIQQLATEAGKESKKSFDEEYQARTLLNKAYANDEAGQARINKANSVKEAIELAMKENNITKEGIALDIIADAEGSRNYRGKKALIADAYSALQEANKAEKQSLDITKQANEAQNKKNLFLEKYKDVLQEIEGTNNEDEQKTEEQQLATNGSGGNGETNTDKQKELDAIASFNQLKFEMNATAVELAVAQEKEKWDKIEAVLNEAQLKQIGFYQSRDEALAAIKEGEQAKEIEKFRAAEDKFHNEQVKKQNKTKEDNQKILNDQIDAEIATAKAKMEIWSATSDGFASFTQLISEMTGESAEIQKAFALVQIAIDTASGLSNIVQRATIAGLNAAKASGLAAPVVGPAFTAADYIQGAAFVATGMARAKKALSNSGGAKKKRAKGGFLNGPSHSNSQFNGMPLLDLDNGRIDNILEGDELVLSKVFTQNNPELANIAADSSVNRNGANILPELLNLAQPQINTQLVDTITQINQQQDGKIAAYFAQNLAANQRMIALMEKGYQTPAPVSLQQFKEVDQERADFYNRAGGTLGD